MKTITLEEAYKLIESASAVIVDDNVVTYPSLYELTGNPDDEWLFMKWEDEDSYHEFTLSFSENCGEIKFDGTNLWINDITGEENMITLLVPMKVEA